MATVIDEEQMKLKGKGNLPFDINKPPLKNAPHQDFPKMLYRWPKDKTLHPTSKTTIAQNAEEEKALLAKGWRDTPHVQEHPEDVPDGFEADDPTGTLPEVAAAADADVPADDSRKKGKKAN